MKLSNRDILWFCKGLFLAIPITACFFLSDKIQREEEIDQSLSGFCTSLREKTDILKFECLELFVGSEKKAKGETK